MSNSISFSLASNLNLYQPECPYGLTGSGCLKASCNSTFTPAANRVARVDTAACSTCPPGFGGGINCNICQRPDACQVAQAAIGHQVPSSGTTSGSFGSSSGLSGSLVPPPNNTAVCVNTPRVITQNQIQCDINQPTLAGIFAGSKFQLTAIKTAASSNLTSAFSTIGLAPYNAVGGSYTSQIWLDGQLQWGCQATNCTSVNSTDPSISPSGSSKTVTDLWTCTDLKCACIPGSQACGGGAFDLSTTVNSLSGSSKFACEYPSDEAQASQSQMKCRFSGASFDQTLGPEGLPLTNCQAGACVTQSELSDYWTSTGVTLTAQDAGLSGGVIAGLCVLGIAVLALLLAIVAGLLMRRRAQKAPRDPPTAAVGLEWSSLHYHVKQRTVAAPAALFSKSGASPGSSAKDDGSYELAPESSATEKLARIKPVQLASSGGHILRNVSGQILPGTLLGIVGPSGAGKTSLVDLLAGRAKAGVATGSISFLPDQSSRARRMVAFVDQDDVLPAFSTVREALQLAANMSLPENVPSDERHEIVNRVLLQLGLEHIAERRIGDSYRRGVSGGEKRRISIGIALVGQPKLLVMDEPLSGLDSMNASRVVAALRGLASGPETGTTVIMTIHQPSSWIFEQFDDIMLMSQGRVLFNGRPQDTVGWFESRGESIPANHNPADHLLSAAFQDMERTPQTSSEFPANTRSSLISPYKQRKPVASLLTQVGCLASRNFQTAYRDPSSAMAHVLGSIVIALITGAAFFKVNLTIAGFQNRVGSIFFLLLLLAFASLSAMTGLNRARTLVVRERSNGLYSAFSWILSHLLYDLLLLRLVPTTILTVIIYFMVGLASDAGIFFQFFLIAVVFNFATTLYFMALAAFFEDLSIPTLLAGLAILFQLGFGGFLLNLNSVPGTLQWIKWICPLRYALEAMATLQLPGLRIKDVVNGVTIDAPVSVFAPNLFGFVDGSYYRDLLVLALGFMLFFFGLLVTAVTFRMRELR